MDSKRKSGVDLAKIIAMFMICALHFVGKGGVLDSQREDINYFGYIVKAVSIGAVNIYMLASGYLLCNSKFKLRRIIAVWTETFFYSVIIYCIITLLTGFQGMNALLKSVLPIITMEYWYISAYVLLMLFVPFINSAIEKLDYRTAWGTVCAIIFVFSVWKTMFPQNGLLETGQIQGYGIVWMICMYIVGAVLRQFPLKIRKTSLLLVGYLGATALIIIMQYSFEHIDKLNGYATFFDYNNFLVVIASICLFLFLVNWDNIEKQKRSLANIANHTLAVYIIQEQICFKNILWSFIANMGISKNIFIFILISFVGICLVFVSCVLIDIGRSKLFEKIKINEWIEKNIQIKMYRKGKK